MTAILAEVILDALGVPLKTSVYLWRIPTIIAPLPTIAAAPLIAPSKELGVAPVTIFQDAHGALPGRLASIPELLRVACSLTLAVITPSVILAKTLDACGVATPNCALTSLPTPVVCPPILATLSVAHLLNVLPAIKPEDVDGAPVPILVSMLKNQTACWHTVVKE